MEVNSDTSPLVGSPARWMNATSLLDKLTDRRVLATLAAVLALYAALSTARMVTNTLAWYGATDLYSWWWSGHVIRQGGDPYQAYFDHTVIELPVRYLDGFVVHSLPISRGLPAVPTNSPPMLFLLHLLSYLSWDTAKVTWMLLNMAMVATIPWLVLRLLPVRLNALFQLIIVLAFYGMLGPRMAVAQGQTSPLVFLLMLSTLLWVRKQHRWLPGVALGIALSKCSVGN